jgi:hypothetical protein
MLGIIFGLIYLGPSNPSIRKGTIIAWNARNLRKTQKLFTTALLFVSLLQIAGAPLSIYMGSI